MLRIFGILVTLLVTLVVWSRAVVSECDAQERIDPREELRKRSESIDSLKFSLHRTELVFEESAVPTKSTGVRFDVRVKDGAIDFRQSASDDPKELDRLCELRTLQVGDTLYRYDAIGTPKLRICSLDGEEPRPTEPAKHIVLLPVLAALVPMQRASECLSIKSYEVQPERSEINETSCIVLKSAAEPPLVNRYFCDYKRGGIPIRYDSFVHGKKSLQLDIEYADSESGPIPNKWRMSHYDIETGNLILVTETRVLTFEINQEIPKAEMRLDETVVPAETRITRD